jgi:Zn-dependent protease
VDAVNFLAIALEEGWATRLVAGMLAWGITMGLHEGGHAWAAYKLGDPTAYYMGKRTINPIKHVDWNNPFSVISAVVIPAATSLMWGFPIGMAWVPVNPSNFRHPTRDHAIVAFAGPAGDFVAAIGCFALWLLLWPLYVSHGDAVAVELLMKIVFVTYLAAIAYGVFNLVPIPPLDGSNVAYHFANESLRNIMDKIRPYGFMIIIVVFWIAGGGRLLSPVIEALLWPFFNVPPMLWGSG